MTIKIDTEHENLKSLYKEILDSLENIEVIELDEKGVLETSSLISMLVSLNSTTDITVPFLKDNNAYINGLGKIVVKDN